MVQKYYNPNQFNYFTDVFAVNIALSKTGTFCNKAVSKKLFDGDVDNVVHLVEKCADKANVEIDLREKYRIDYVIVYAGEGRISSNTFI